MDYLVYWNRKLIRESIDNQVFAIWRDKFIVIYPFFNYNKSIRFV